MGQINPVALEYFRRLKGIKQQDLARAVSLTPQQYNKIERGARKASAETIQALAAQLGVPDVAICNWCTTCAHLRIAS